MKKRIFASLLAIVMAFSLLPASALAANATVKITEGSGTDYGTNTHNVTLKQGTPAGTVYYIRTQMAEPYQSLLTNPESIKCCRFIGMEGIIILRQIIW